jgi:hypothetical protein
MVRVEVSDSRLLIRLDRTDKLWAFKGTLEVPLEHVVGVEVDPERARIPWSGLPIREPGSRLPGMLWSGDVREQGRWAFWDVRDPERAVIIDLEDERYDRLVIEVDDPAATAAAIRRALAERKP